MSSKKTFFKIHILYDWWKFEVFISQTKSFTVNRNFRISKMSTICGRESREHPAERWTLHSWTANTRIFPKNLQHKHLTIDTFFLGGVGGVVQYITFLLVSIDFRVRQDSAATVFWRTGTRHTCCGRTQTRKVPERFSRSIRAVVRTVFEGCEEKGASTFSFSLEKKYKKKH